jgi:CBS domain-containing protein
MNATAIPLLEMTASDLMSRDVLTLSQDMPLRDAARCLVEKQIGGAPVVDEHGCCVGVLTSIDFLRSREKRHETGASSAEALPLSCPFQAKQTGTDGEEKTLCLLPPGVCPIQMKQVDSDGNVKTVCSQPHCVMTDWQVVPLEKLPVDPVHSFMTADPVTVPPETSIRTLARDMLDAHIHRLVVVDTDRRPIGILSSTDVLAAVAYAEEI